MTFNKTEKKYMRRALLLAIDYDESLIDAHKVAFDKRGPQLKKVLPKEYRPLAVRCQRNIEGFRKLLAKLDERHSGDTSE